MYFSMENGRIPLAANSVVDLGPDQRYVIDRFAAGTNFSLMYLVHPQSQPDRRLLLKELYPHPRVREEEVIQRLEDGTIRIWNPFSGICGADDQTLLTRYRRCFEKEAALYPQASCPLSAGNGNLYLVIDAVPAGTLQTLLTRSGTACPNPMLGSILRLLEETAVQLQALPCCHLELTPEQILLLHRPGDDSDHACLQDLGACASAETDNIARDIYALCTMLYQAAAGTPFDSANSAWAEPLRRYDSQTAPETDSPSFAQRLTDFLRTGLSPQPQTRFSSAAALAEALRGLREEYEGFRSLLPLIPRDELASYLLLDRHPLYQYQNSQGEIHVLCLGCGSFGRRMILSLISCGQILGTSLHIHAVSREDPEQLRSRLLQAAPMLAEFSDLVRPAEHQKVFFHLDQVPDLLDPAACRNILSAHSDARYMVISLGSGEQNIRAVRLYTQGLAAMSPAGTAKTILNYYCPENTMPAVLPAPLPEWLTVDAFGDHLQSYGPVALRLTRLAIRLTHLQGKKAQPRLSLQESAEQLSASAALQRAGCAAALHLRCKLAGLGIDPAAPVGKITAAWQKALASDRREALLENEYTRRLLLLTAEGCTPPTPEQLRQDPAGTHPAMVPWGDGLEEMTRTLHRISGERCRDILSGGDISRMFQAISQKLEDAIREARQQSGIREALWLSRLNLLGTQLAQTKKTVTDTLKALQAAGVSDSLTRLETSFKALDLDISREILELKQLLRAFEACANPRDIRQELEHDLTHLPWVLFAGRRTTLIKLPGRTLTDHFTAPLAIDPDQLLFFGAEEQPQWVRFLRSRGCQAQISFLPPREDNIYAGLRQLLVELDTGCILDITGTSEEAAAAAFRLCLENRRTALIRSRSDGSLENMYHCPLAPAYPRPAPLTAAELCLISGEEPDAPWQMAELAPALWKLHCRFRKKWDMISAFFSLPAASPAELQITGLVPEEASQWPMKHYILTPEK